MVWSAIQLAAERHMPDVIMLPQGWHIYDNPIEGKLAHDDLEVRVAEGSKRARQCVVCAPMLNAGLGNVVAVSRFWGATTESLQKCGKCYRAMLA